MRILKRQVPLPLSSLLPVPLSDLYFNLSPTAIERYFRGGYKDGDGGFLSLQLPPPSSIADRQIQRDLKKEKEKALKVCECLLRKGPLSPRDISRLAESEINQNKVKDMFEAQH